jgi:hypothetical protein
MHSNRTRIASLGAGVAVVLGLSGLGHAKAAEGEPPVAPTLNCRDTGRFSPPTIPWIGDFIYKVSIGAKQGRPEKVDIETIRGPDTGSNHQVVSALKQHIREHYACEGEASNTELYLSVKFKHDRPKGQAEWEQVVQAERQNAAARAASAVQANMAAGTLEPARAAMVCTKMGKPDLPRVNAVGTLELQALALVTDGRVTAVDIKLMVGSKDAALNQKFIDMVERTMRDTYVCPGNSMFEQRFLFKIS